MPYWKSIFTHPGRARAFWIALLVTASVAFTFGFACAVPFAAFGAVAALTLSRRDALASIMGLWLVNQVVGFTILHYPWDGLTLLWGAVLGVVAVLTTAAAQVAAANLGKRNFIATTLVSFVAAFVVYEGGLYLVSVTAMGGAEDFAAAIVLRILEINATAFVGLVLLSQVAERLGLLSGPSGLVSTSARHA